MSIAFRSENIIRTKYLVKCCLLLAFAMVSAGNPKVDLLVAISRVTSCRGDVEPGFGIVAFDWSHISPLGKLIGLFWMWIGRQEMLPFFLLSIPELWKK